jgi:hypothetical protein
VTVLFQTAPAGASFEVVYDRRDPLQLAPFPDDFWIVEDPSLPSGNAIDFPVPPFSELFQLQAFQALQALTVGVDGWSRQPPIVLAFTGAPAQVVPDDLFASQDPMATIWLVDVDPQSPDYGRRIPYEVMLRSDWAPDGTVDHVAILFPSIDLRERGQYAVVVTRRAGFGPSPFFEEVLSEPKAGDAPELVKARESILPTLEVLAALPDVPIPPEDVALAIRISIRTHPSVADLVHIKELALAAPPPQLILPDIDVDPCPAPDFCVQTSWTRGLLARGWVGCRIIATPLPYSSAIPSPRCPSDRHPPGTVRAQPSRASARRAGHPNHRASTETGKSTRVLGSWNEHLDDAGFALAGMPDTLNREIGQDVGNQTLVMFFLLMGHGQVPDLEPDRRRHDPLLAGHAGLGSLDLMRRGAGRPAELGSTGSRRSILPSSCTKGYARAQSRPASSCRSPRSWRRPRRWAHRAWARSCCSTPPRRYARTDRRVHARAPPVELWVGVSLFQLRYDPQDGHTYLRHLYRQPLTPFAGSSDTTPPSTLWTEGIGDLANNNIRAGALELGIPRWAARRSDPTSGCSTRP